MRNRNTVKTIAVIVGLDLVGDGLIKLPFLRTLRAAFPAAEISWVTAQGPTVYGGILRNLVRPFLDHVIEQPEWLPSSVQRRPDKRAPHFDLIIDTRGRWRGTLLARRIPHRIFLSPACRYLLSDRRPPRFWRKQTHIQDRLQELAILAAGVHPKPEGVIALPDAMRIKASAVLPDGRRYVGLVPGAGNDIKIWPRENFIALAVHLARQGYVPAFLLGPKETAWLPELRQAVPQACFPLQNQAWDGAISLEGTMAIGERLSCAVTNDNGTSHMLAAVDCPLISLFGPTSAAKLAPRVSRAKIIVAQQFGRDDMAAIPVQAVAQAAEDLLRPDETPDAKISA